MKGLPLLLIALFLLASAAYVRAGEAGVSDQLFSGENLQYDFALGLLRRGLHKEAAAEFGKFLTQYPQSARAPEALLNRAEAFFAAAEYPLAARDYYDYVVRNKPDSLWPRLRYGICLYEMTRYADAVKALEPLVAAAKDKKDEAAFSALYYTGMSQQKLGQLVPARENLLRVEGGNLRPLALYALAESYLAGKEYENAAKYFGMVGTDFPEHTLAQKARLARGNALRLAGKLEESGADFGKLLESDDPAVRIRAQYALAWTNQDNGKPEEARRLAQEVLKSPGGGEFHPGAHYLLGTIAFNAGDFKTARTHFTASLEAEKSGGEFAPRAALARCWTLYRLKEYDSALGAIKEMRAGFADYAPQELAYLAGRCLLEAERFNEAGNEFRTARAIKGGREEQAAYEMALALERAGDNPAAAEAFAYFTENFPQSGFYPAALGGLGQTLMAQGRYEAAVPVYTQLLAHKGLGEEQARQALSNKAICYYYLKQYDNMALSYEHLLKDYPQSPQAAQALFWLGWHDSSEKKYLEAAKRYGELLRRFPQDALAPRAQYYMGAAYLHGGEETKAAETFYALARSGRAPIDGRELLWLGQFFYGAGAKDKAAEVYRITIAQEKRPSLVLAVARRGLGQINLDAQDWTAARENYEALEKLLGKDGGLSIPDAQRDIAAALRNEAYYAQAVCLREQGDTPAARAMLERVNVAGDDPFSARVFFERGMLDLAGGEHKKALENLMRVGLLVEDQELAGRALLKAAEASLALKDKDKARICYEELAGKFEGSYGKLYPDSPYVAEGKKLLEKLEKGGE